MIPPTHPGSRLAIEWLVRLAHLHESLADRPTDSQAWRWRIQVKVLSFFLARYGDDPSLDRPHDTPVHHPPALQPPPNSGGAQLHSREFIRHCLEGIAAANRASGHRPLYDSPP